MESKNGRTIVLLSFAFLGAYIVVEAYNAGARDERQYFSKSRAESDHLPADSDENSSPSEPDSSDEAE